jgi:hypothetical protein
MIELTPIAVPCATEFNPAGPVREPAWMRALMILEYY